MLDTHRLFLADGIVPIVPTIVLGQVWRNVARAAAMSRLLKGCRLDPLDVVTAKLGGQLCGYAGTKDLADAVVAVLAAQLAGAIVTSDPEDLRHLAEATGREVTILPI
jgi:hypothetical protein